MAAAAGGGGRGVGGWEEEEEEAAEEGPGRSGNGELKSRFIGRGRRSELARRGRGLGGRSGSMPAANIPGNTHTEEMNMNAAQHRRRTSLKSCSDNVPASTAPSTLRLLKAAEGPLISDRVLLVGAGGTTGLGQSYS